MEKSTARTVNRVVSVLHYIGGILGALGGLTMLLIGSAFIGTESGLLGALGAFVGVFLVILGVVGIVAGYGLWAQRNWARILVIILAAIGALNALGMLVSGAGGFFSLVIDAVLIWLYGFQKDMIKLFK